MEFEWNCQTRRNKILIQSWFPEKTNRSSESEKGKMVLNSRIYFRYDSQLQLDRMRLVLFGSGTVVRPCVLERCVPDRTRSRAGLDRLTSEKRSKSRPLLWHCIMMRHFRAVVLTSGTIMISQLMQIQSCLPFPRWLRYTSILKQTQTFPTVKILKNNWRNFRKRTQKQMENNFDGSRLRSKRM